MQKQRRRSAVQYSLHGKYNSSSTFIQKFKLPVFFCDCTGRLLSDLVGNSEDRFSRVAAQIIRKHKSGRRKLHAFENVCHNVFAGYIRKTCPSNIYPLKPHFYIVKLGFAGVYLFFTFLLQNIDCGYSLEPPR